jgi:hypothetical protein
MLQFRLYTSLSYWQRRWTNYKWNYPTPITLLAVITHKHKLARIAEPAGGVIRCTACDVTSEAVGDRVGNTKLEI